jgi:hypothetical protein
MMRVCKEFRVLDLIDYEMLNGISILDELSFGSTFILFDMVKLGNNCDDEQAQIIIDKSFEEIGYEETFKEVFYEIIGKYPDNSDDTYEDDSIHTFSELFEQYFSSIQCVDSSLTYHDFLNMNTRYVHRYANNIKDRFIFNKNMEIQSQYFNVVMFMSALAGKLKDCPQLDEDGTLHKETLEEKINRIARGDFK